MRQVLFHVPILKDRMSADGIPIYGFGAMLFLAFVVVTWWGSRRAARVGLSPSRFQDMDIVLFVSGLIGARLLYMIQYADQFPDQSLWGLATAFVQIWRGGIIFYGSAFGGVVGYALFYWFVLRRLKINGWQLADAVAPLLALGLAVGRIGCYLNGCCWGQVANEASCPIPLGAAHFPLLPAHARDSLVSERGLQTSTGFAVAPRDFAAVASDDPRSVVSAVEARSPAAGTGLKAGDRIVGFNGRANAVVLEVAGSSEKVAAALAIASAHGATVDAAAAERPGRALFDRPDDYRECRKALSNAGHGDLTYAVRDLLSDVARDWPRGRAELQLDVRRDGKDSPLPAFTPETVGLYPTQLYETVSMVLLIGVLLAYYPFRSHDGELMVLVMIGYAVHRFLNESLRIEPTVGLGLTLSQWGSVVILVAALGIEAFLWIAMPSRWRAIATRKTELCEPTA